jgi:hypothetical protein
MQLSFQKRSGRPGKPEMWCAHFCAQGFLNTAGSAFGGNSFALKTYSDFARMKNAVHALLFSDWNQKSIRHSNFENMFPIHFLFWVIFSF